jgi:hypothetical protein
MKANIVYNGINRPTVDNLINVGKEIFDIDFKRVLHYVDNDLPTIYCGKFDKFYLDKPQTLEYLKDIIDNTLITDVTTLNKNDVVVLKEPLRIMLYKDTHDHILYKYINNKSEWRINVSYNKVNQILNKNLKNEPFGKADLTQWTPEQDKKVRKILKDYAHKIYDKVHTDYPRIEHFGLDIIRDDITNKYYLLELNRANGLNEESCIYLLDGFVENYGGDEDG